jgi:hypothetical protein
MTVVQVAINPYVTVIGPAATASSRLNLAQAFNSFGTFIAPFLGAYLILARRPQLTPEHPHSMSAVKRQAYRVTPGPTVRHPYLAIASPSSSWPSRSPAIKLKPQHRYTDLTQDFRPGAFAEALSKPDSIWKHPWLLAALGIFTYVGAEVSHRQPPRQLHGPLQIAGLQRIRRRQLPHGLLGRRHDRPLHRLSRPAARQAPARPHRQSPPPSPSSSSASSPTATLAMFAMLAVGICNSIMFPSIFTLGIQDLGPLTSKGSSLMIAAIVGGALIPEARASSPTTSACTRLHHSRPLLRLHRGLRHRLHHDGGSSGRLREDLNMLPPGDVRNCMVALSEDEHLLSRLFQHRFAHGDLEGHSFGNLFLAALTEISGDFAQAVQAGSQILATRGRIYPSTTANARLSARMDDGSLVQGETSITASKADYR